MMRGILFGSKGVKKDVRIHVRANDKPVANGYYQPRGCTQVTKQNKVVPPQSGSEEHLNLILRMVPQLTVDLGYKNKVSLTNIHLHYPTLARARQWFPEKVLAFFPS